MKSEFLLSCTGSYTWQSLTATETCSFFISWATLLAVCIAWARVCVVNSRGADFTVMFLSVMRF